MTELSLTDPTTYPRKVLFVAGAGRSGTSTMAGLMRIMGLHVPQPEVVADETNPKGFGEPRWVVDHHQLQIVVIVGFPQLTGESQVVIAVVWNQLILAYFVPLFRGCNSGRTHGINLQADGRAPGHRIFHEAHLFAIPGK